MDSHLNTVDVPLTSYTNGFLNYQNDSTIIVPPGRLYIYFASEGTVVYSGSRRKTMFGNLSATFPQANGGQYYFYIDDSFNLVYAHNPTATRVGEIILKYALVAIGTWSASQRDWVVLTDERHGATKFSIDHLTEHLTIGAEYESGFDVTSIIADGDGSLNDHASVTIANGKQQDEDLRHDIDTSDGIKQLFNVGGVWEKYGYQGQTFLPYEVSRVPQFNQLSGGVWSMQPVPANHYFVVYLYTVPTVSSGHLPSLYAITASQTFANKNEAQAFAKRAPQLEGLPSQEMLLCYSFLLQHKTTFTNIVKSAIVKLDDGSDYYDWRKRAPTSVGGGIVGNNQSDIPTMDDVDRAYVAYQEYVPYLSSYTIIGTNLSVTGTNVTTGFTPANNVLNKPTSGFRQPTVSPSAVVKIAAGIAIVVPMRLPTYYQSSAFLPDALATIATHRFALGIVGTAPTTDVNPSTFFNCVMLAYDTADTTVKIMHNDGSGTCTKIDTGWVKPTAANQYHYFLKLKTDPATGTVSYEARRWNSTNFNEDVFSGVINTNLPASSVSVVFFSFASAGGTASAAQIQMGRTVLKSWIK